MGVGGSTGGSGNGIKNFDLVMGKKKFCTDNKHHRNFLSSRLGVRFDNSGCCVKRYHPFGCASDLSQRDASSLPTRITKGH